MVERTKRDILNAFNKLIRVRDIEKITVEMLITEASISKATFYRYFKDKYEVMNYNYTILLDSLIDNGTCKNYKELFAELYHFGKKNWKSMRKAFETTGINSFSNYIEKYSRALVERVTLENRGTSLTEIEKLQCDVFFNGIPYMYERWIFEKYALKADEAAEALYLLMPETLRDMWLIDNK